MIFPAVAKSRLSSGGGNQPRAPDQGSLQFVQSADVSCLIARSIVKIRWLARWIRTKLCDGSLDHHIDLFRRTAGTKASEKLDGSSPADKRECTKIEDREAGGGEVCEQALQHVPKRRPVIDKILRQALVQRL